MPPDADETMSDDLINLEIDGIPVQAKPGSRVIKAADDAGIKIPRFCYHPNLSIAANCRMCLVQVDKIPKPLPACATTIAEGMKVFTGSPLARGAQKAVMEFLLINHPLDCPICDQGGECELQDLALGYGKDVSRYQEGKRAVREKDIGPLIATEMTRCIHCTRCVRFGKEIAGMPQMGATGRGEWVEIGTFIEQSLDSELSGNIIDICPVGALTSKVNRFQGRAWELRQHASIAAHDGVGSNISVHTLRNQVLRNVPRTNADINEVWISDRDRFSYQGLYSDDRLQQPMLKRDGNWQEVDWDTALQAAAEGLKKYAGNGLGALASASQTVEELYLLQKLTRALGSENIDHRLRVQDVRDQQTAPLFPGLGCSISELGQQDAILLIGSNLRKEQPMLQHRVRKAVQAGGALMAVNPVDYAFNCAVEEQLVVAPNELFDNLAGIAAALEVAGITAKVSEEQAAIAKRLKSGEQSIVLLGASALNHPDAAALRAISERIANATSSKLGTLPEGANAAGAWLAGCVPHRGPAGKSVNGGLATSEMFAAKLGAYLLLGFEPERDCADAGLARKALNDAEFVVMAGAYRSAEMEAYADVLLPIGLYPETSGTVVNLAGEWQSFAGAAPSPGEGRPAWKVLRVLGNLVDADGFEYENSTEVLAELRGLVDQPRIPFSTSAAIPECLAGVAENELQRIGDVAPYATDALVRRASALQQTGDGDADYAAINPALAERLGLLDAAEVTVSQNGAEAHCSLRVDAAIPDACVRVPAGTATAANLASDFGAITLSHSTEGQADA